MVAMQRRCWLIGLAVLMACCWVTGAAVAGVPAWTTYRHDGTRSGIDSDSASPVAPTQAWQTPALDGSIYAQPLVYGSRVYVATENDTVLALDAATGSVVWQKHLATPVDAGALNCGNITPTVGITSTPVIDPVTGRIYVVGDTWDGSHPASIAHEMWGLNLGDGSIGMGPVNVDPAGTSPIDQLQRTSLALDAGKVLIGYGANSGDCGNYNGWLVSEREDGTAMQTFEVDSQQPNGGGAIWASGNAPAIDAAGNIWISTGNGPSSDFGYQESVIKLDLSLNVLDWWAPSNWSNLDISDTDIGSSMPVLLPGGLVFQIGKAGTGYLLSAASLGHTGGSAYSHAVCNGSWGGGIYVGGVIYVACANGLHAEALNNGALSALSGWTVNASAIDAPTYAGGLVWSTDYNSGTLYGLDPHTGATRFSANLNGFEHFTSPSAAGGLLFVANQDASAAGDDVTAFRIANTPPPSPTATTLGSSANPAATGQTVTLTATVTPAPDSGTVAFTDSGAAIAGCGAAPVNVASGQATCTTSFGNVGRQGLVAAYPGDAYYLGSSGSLDETVSGAGSPGPGSATPMISHLRVKVVHRKLRISLTLSEAAKLTVVVSRLVPGRRVHRHCRVRARRGRRCTAAQHRTTIRLSGRRGKDSFQPRMRALPPGRYAITVTALSPSRRRSRPHTVVVVVRRA
jgi:outer membrane protein assembly factor BamB